jgi:hypothetical protein
MNAGDRFKPIQNLSELSRWKDYLNRQIMLNVVPDYFLQEMLNNKEAFNVATYKAQLKNKNVLLIEAGENNDHWINLLENVDRKMIRSDHNFISNRVELTTIIVNWLEEN